VLEVRDVHKKFGSVRAVRGVSFAAASGKVTALLGPNGAGKTTTIRMVTGFLPPDAGAIAVNGFDTLDRSREARSCIGYMPENTPLYAEMTVRGFLDYRARLFGLASRDRRAALDRWIARCWLDQVHHRRIGTLSKGFKQRVGLAAALLHDPRLLILDEPTNGLDPEQVRQTRALVRELAADRAVVITSHVLAEVELVCDRVVIIAAGEVKADNTPAELVATSSGVTSHIAELNDPSPETWLATIPGVANAAVRARNGAWTTCALTGAAPSLDLREAIAAAARDRGVLIRELRRESPNLESLFLELIGRGR
jgi:ABC-2 type transport system ATP-binding protein